MEMLALIDEDSKRFCRNTTVSWATEEQARRNIHAVSLSRLSLPKHSDMHRKSMKESSWRRWWWWSRLMDGEQTETLRSNLLIENQFQQSYVSPSLIFLQFQLWTLTFTHVQNYESAEDEHGAWKVLLFADNARHQPEADESCVNIEARSWNQAVMWVWKVQIFSYCHLS